MMLKMEVKWTQAKRKRWQQYCLPCSQCALFVCASADMIRTKFFRGKKNSLTAQVLHQWYELHIRLNEQVNTMFDMIYVPPPLLACFHLLFAFSLPRSPFIDIIQLKIFSRIIRCCGISFADIQHFPCASLICFSRHFSLHENRLLTIRFCDSLLQQLNVIESVFCIQLNRIDFIV